MLGLQVPLRTTIQSRNRCRSDYRNLGPSALAGSLPDSCFLSPFSVLPGSAAAFLFFGKILSTNGTPLMNPVAEPARITPTAINKIRQQHIERPQHSRHRLRRSTGLVRIFSSLFRFGSDLELGREVADRVAGTAAVGTSSSSASSSTSVRFPVDVLLENENASRSSWDW